MITIETSKGWSPLRLQNCDHQRDSKGVITIETSKWQSPVRFQKAITIKTSKRWSPLRRRKGAHQSPKGWSPVRFQKVITSEIPKGDHQWNTKRWPTRHQNVMITFYLLKSFCSLFFLCFCVSLIPQLLCEHDLYMDSKCSINKSLAIIILTNEVSDDCNQFEVFRHVHGFMNRFPQQWPKSSGCLVLQRLHKMIALI